MNNMDWLYSEAEILFQRARQKGGTKHEAVREVVDYCRYMMTNIESERDQLRRERDHFRRKLQEIANPTKFGLASRICNLASAQEWADGALEIPRDPLRLASTDGSLAADVIARSE